MSEVQYGRSGRIHSSSSYTPARMVRSAVIGHLSVAPLSEKQ